MARPKKAVEEVAEEVEVVESNIDKMNDLAARVWDNQSVSLPIIDRVDRIKAALLSQGYDDLSGLVLPVPEKYL